MDIINNTKICDLLIKEIALSMGVDLKCEDKLYIEYSADLKGGAKDDNLGTCQSTVLDGRNLHLIRLLPWSSTETLAHELRHVYQAQVYGADVLNVLYQDEMDSEGYEENVFEIDARETAKVWRV